MKRCPIITCGIVVFILGKGGATESCTEIGAEDTALSISGDFLARLHIAELGAAAEERHVAVVNICSDVAGDRLGVVDAATEEVVDVGIVYLPPHVAVDFFQCRSCRRTDILHRPCRSLQHAAAAHPG